MPDIRANSTDMPKLLKERDKALKHGYAIEFLKTHVTFNTDENLSRPVVMAKHGNEELKAWFEGYDDVVQFIWYGYHRIIRFCPLLKQECIGEKCQWFLFDPPTGVGDCSIKYSAIISLEALREGKPRENN